MNEKLNCVLLVEDDESTNYYNKIIINKADITKHIQVTWNGKEAIEFLENRDSHENYSQPELIFLDINMPKMDGWDFLEEYEKLTDVQRGKIVIIMLTTSSNPDDLKKAENFPLITCFKHKPLTVDILKEIMEKYFMD